MAKYHKRSKLPDEAAEIIEVAGIIVYALC